MTGAQAWKAIANSAHFAWVPRDIPAKDAAKLFLPPVEEARLEMYRPLPAERQTWLDDFEEARRNDQ